MFSRNFSFEAPRFPERSPTYSDSNSITTRDTSRSVSPCSTSASSSTSYSIKSNSRQDHNASVTDITSQFASHRLRREALIAYEPCDSYANLDDDDAAWRPEGADEGWFCTRERSRTSIVQRPHSPSRRTQRQVNTRLLCSGNHRAEIARLVERMVERGDQCEIAPPTSITHPVLAAEEDEGYDSDDASGLRSRSSSGHTSRPRSWEYKGSMTHARVSKSIRSRRDKSSKRRSSQAVPQ